MTNSPSFVCPVSGETPSEERVNYLTHFLGFILSLMGLIVLLKATFTSSNSLALISSLIYGTTLIMLYGASTFYHRCQKVDRKRTLRIIDHICIYLLIAGSYTPFSLGPLKESGGLLLLSLIWSVAFFGIALKISAFHRFQTLSLFLYLIMGWMILYNLPVLIDELSFAGLWWLIAGGVTYTLGTFFYIWNALAYNHAVWHLFVLGGSICHFFSVLEVIKG